MEIGHAPTPLSLAQLAQTVVGLYHPTSSGATRANSNDVLMAYQKAETSWNHSLEIMRGFSANFAEVSQHIPPVNTDQGQVIPPNEVAEYLLYFAANCIALRAKTAVPFVAALRSGMDDLSSLRKELAELLYLYKAAPPVVLNQLTVAASASIIFECSTATVPVEHVAFVISSEEIASRGPQLEDFCVGDNQQMRMMKNQVIAATALLSGQVAASGISSNRLWLASDMYSLIKPGDQISQLLVTFKDHPTALFSLLKEIADELNDPKIGGVSNEGRLRACAWLLPHTYNILEVVSAEVARNSELAVKGLEVSAAWLQLHNTIEVGPPEDMTWGRLCHVEARKRRLAAPNALQRKIANLYIIDELPNLIAAQATLKPSCEVAGQIVSLSPYFTAHNSATMGIVISALARVAPLISKQLLAANPFATRDPAEAVALMAGTGFYETEAAATVFWGIAQDFTERARTGGDLLAGSDCYMTPEWTPEEVMDNQNDDDSGHILAWLSSVDTLSSTISVAASESCSHLEPITDMLVIVNATRALLFHSCFAVRTKAIEALASFLIFDDGQTRGDVPVYTQQQSTNHEQLQEAAQRCGPLGIVLSKKGCLDPTDLVAALMPSIVMANMPPKGLNGIDDEVERGGELRSGTSLITKVAARCLPYSSVSAWIRALSAIVSRALGAVVAHHNPKQEAVRLWNVVAGSLRVTSRLCIVYTDHMDLELAKNILTAWSSICPDFTDPRNYVAATGMTAAVVEYLAMAVPQMLMINGKEPSLLGGEEGAKQTFLQVSQVILVALRECNNVGHALQRSQQAQNAIGQVNSVAKLEQQKSMEVIVESFQNFIQFSSSSIREVINATFLQQYIETFGGLLLDRQITSLWRVWILMALGEMVRQIPESEAQGPFRFVLDTLQKAVVDEVNEAWTRYPTEQRNNDDQGGLLPAKFVREIESMTRRNLKPEELNEEQRRGQDLLDGINLFWQTFHYFSSQSRRYNEPPPDIKMWPRSEENEIYQIPSFVILQEYFDRMADLSLITLSGEHGAIDGVSTCVYETIKKRHLCLRYPVTRTYLMKMTQSQLRKPSMFQLNALRTFLPLTQNVSGMFPEENETLDCLAECLDVACGPIVANLLRDGSTCATQPQLVGMATDTLGIALQTHVAIGRGLLSRPALEGFDRNATVGLIDFGCSSIEHVEDIKVLLTLLLLYQRAVVWWCPIHLSDQIVNDRFSGSQQVMRILESIAQPLANGQTIPQQELQPIAVTAIQGLETMRELCERHNWYVRIPESLMRLLLTKYDGRAEWLGLASNVFCDIADLSQNIKEKMLQGIMSAVQAHWPRQVDYIRDEIIPTLGTSRQEDSLREMVDRKVAEERISDFSGQ